MTARWTDRMSLRIKCGRLAKFGPWAEFGTYKGDSARQLLSAMPQDVKLYLFDWWKGLPEDWEKGHRITPKGTFATKAIPKFDDDRVELVEGLFQDTLPGFFSGPLGLCHIDSDLYSSAACVLENVELIPGSVLIFDEIFNNGNKPGDRGHYPNWKAGEYRAYQEWCERTGLSVEWRYSSIGSAGGIVR